MKSTSPNSALGGAGRSVIEPLSLGSVGTSEEWTPPDVVAGEEGGQADGRSLASVVGRIVDLGDSPRHRPAVEAFATTLTRQTIRDLQRELRRLEGVIAREQRNANDRVALHAYLVENCEDLQVLVDDDWQLLHFLWEQHPHEYAAVVENILRRGDGSELRRRCSVCTKFDCRCNREDFVPLDPPPSVAVIFERRKRAYGESDEADRCALCGDPRVGDTRDRHAVRQQSGCGVHHDATHMHVFAERRHGEARNA